uniref:Codanin-1 n=1 Tax=Daphnia magna TaxID=35525 RepID=A0A0P5J8S4_9CRUS
MALILDLVSGDIALFHVFTWLDIGSVHQDLKELLKDETENIRYSFPQLLIAFIKEQSLSIVKLHNIHPYELHTVSSPKRENVLPTVNNLTLSSPSPNFKNNGSCQETRKIRKITPQRLDLSSDSAFPSLQHSTQTREIPKKRRINPTQLIESPVATRVPLQFGSCSRPSPPALGHNAFNQALEQSCHKSLDQERALLKEKKHQIMIPTISDLGSNTPKNWMCVEPDINFVTKQSQLGRLSALFSFCLSRNLVPSVFSEIQFLIQLLVLRVSPAKLKQTHLAQSLLDSVHNCVYFSAKTLEQVESIWCHVDQSILQQLRHNPRLLLFCSEWTNDKLPKLISSITNVDRIPPHKTVANVAFQTETDNRFNFASDSSFQVFRKQRDQFCEAWQIWKVNSSIPGWNMSIALQKMIQSLVDLRRDCVNYAHLARLFRLQLLNVAQLVKPVNELEEPDGPLGQLQSSDPDKLRRLRDRITNPPESRPARCIGTENDIKMHFEGDQEFFRDFILLAASPAFNEHLKNSLVSGIEDLSSSEDCDDRAQFAETIIALQVMAKFLGFLHFYPHASADHLPEHIFHHLSRLRISQREPIDLVSYIKDAFHKGRLVLVIPWVVTYLTLADPVSLCLPGFHSVLCHLIFVYRKAELAPANSFLIRILLGWLFSQSNFPLPLLAKPDDDLLIEFGNLSLATTDDQLPRLDQSRLVDSSLVHQCCPFLWSWKHLLAEFACSDAKSSGEKASLSRKITPVSAEENPSPVKAPAVKTLQQSLEENFFHNQPSSVKRTVEFVAERLASNVVRDVRHQIIPRLVLNAQATLKTWPSTAKDPVESLCLQLCVDVRNEAASAATSAIASLESTLTALLPNDLLPPVRRVCVSIASKLTQGKVLDWIQLHVTKSLFKNDLEVELAKLDKSCARRVTTPGCPTASDKPQVVHDSTTQAPSFLIDRLKTLIRQVIRDASKVTEQDLTDLLSNSEGTLHRRVDVTPIVSKCLQQLTFDLLFIVCVFQPESVGSQTITAWVAFWCKTYPSVDPAETEEPVQPPGALISTCVWQVLTPKQLLLLAQSTSPRESWNHVTTLLLQLMKSGLVRYKDVQEQAIAVVRQEWPQELLGRFATCVRDIVDWHRNKKSDPNLSTAESCEDDGLLSWLSWFCAQDDL